jgi:CheY-like chemotaxis protein
MSNSNKVESKQREEMKSLNVLIIDDNEQITKMLTTFLELKEHKCTVANDGK